ncbi:MAG: SDR family NAD(P)-dependent oxidoreductase [Pseudomonadota bacterium]
MNSKKDQPVALIAGVAPGLGESLVRRFIAEGYQVFGMARSNRMQDRLGDLDGYFHIECDLTDPEAVSGKINEIEAAHGAFSVAVCNAHKLHIASFLETTTDDLETVWQNTCFSAMTVAKAVIPSMLSQKTGTIIFTGATAGLRGGAKFSAFASAKFALRGFAQALAREFQPQGIHVVHAILDGLLWEEQTIERFDPPQEKCLDPDAVAEAYMGLVLQDQSVWTHEIDFRPFTENF